MAYKNLVLQACASKVEFFCRMRDFICARNGTYDYTTTGIGWTLHDSSYAVDEDNPAINDWVVLKSVGENSKEDIYLQVKWLSGSIAVYGWQYWNNTTHAGVHQYNTAINFTIAESGSYELSVYGDLDFVVVIESINTTYDYLVFAGCLINQLYDNTVAISAAPLSSGSDIGITLDAVPSSWYVGQRVFIRDDANIDIITIKTIAGDVITADLAHTFAAGSKLRADVPYIVNSSASSLSVYSMVGHTTTTVLSLSVAQAPGYMSQIDPEGLNSDYFGASIDMYGTNSYMGQLPHMFRVSSTGLTEKTAFDNGYRYFNIYSGNYLAIKEV